MPALTLEATCEQCKQKAQFRVTCTRPNMVSYACGNCGAPYYPRKAAPDRMAALQAEIVQLKDRNASLGEQLSAAQSNVREMETAERVQIVGRQLLERRYEDLIVAFDAYRACEENHDPVHAEWDALCNARDALRAGDESKGER